MKQQEQIVYNIIATLKAKNLLGIKNDGFSHEQVIKALSKHFPFLIADNGRLKLYYIQRADIYGKVDESIDLISYLQGTYCNITKRWLLINLLTKGYTPEQVLKEYKDFFKREDIYSLRKHIKKKVKQLENREIKKKIKENISKLPKTQKKITLSMLIEYINKFGSIKAKRMLYLYARKGGISSLLRRYGLTTKFIEEHTLEEVISYVVERYLKKKAKITDYQGLLQGLYNHLDFKTLTERYSNSKKSLRHFFKARLLTHSAIDKMIAKSKDFQDFKRNFERYIFEFNIDSSYIIGNKKEVKTAKKRKEINEYLKQKTIKDFDTFLKVAKEEGYMVAVKKIVPEYREKIYKEIYKRFNSVNELKEFLKLEKMQKVA